MGFCGVGNVDPNGEGAFPRPFSISLRFILSLPVVSAISSFDSMWLMSSFDDTSDDAAIVVVYWNVLSSLHYAHAIDVYEIEAADQ